MTCRTSCQCNLNGDNKHGVITNFLPALSGCSGAVEGTQAGTQGTQKGIALAQLGQMLDYPDEEFFSKLERLGASVRSSFPGATKALDKFDERCKEMSLPELEELYTRTFDLAAIASPYITGYIYGDENYDRGTLMACLSENYARLGFELEGELPDHLAQLLRFASWLDDETLNELINYCLRNPVAQMCEQLSSCDNCYFHLLSALETVLNSAPRGDFKQ